MPDSESAHTPLSTYRYRLTLVDALAYEQLPGEWLGRAKLAFFLPLFVIGGFAGFISDWPAVWWWLTVTGLLIAWAVLALALINWRIHRRARKMAAWHGQMEVEEWGDHLAVKSDAGRQNLSYEQIGKVIVTDAHVFVLYRGGATILPLRAFEGVAAMRAFGEAVDRRSDEAAA